VSGQAVAVFNYPLTRAEALRCIWGRRADPSAYVLYPDPEQSSLDASGDRYRRFVINLDAVPQRRAEYLANMNQETRRLYTQFMNSSEIPELGPLPHLSEAGEEVVRQKISAMNPGQTWVSVQPGERGRRVLVWATAISSASGRRIDLEIWRYLPEVADYYSTTYNVSEADARLYYLPWAREVNEWMRRYVEAQEQRWSIDRGLQEYAAAADQRYRMMMINLIMTGGGISGPERVFNAQYSGR
jgi:hypothetical protein